MTPEEQKAVFKEALNEWLEAKYSTLGKWTLATISVAAFGAVLYILLMLGWRPSI